MNIFLTNKNYRRFLIASFLSSAGDILLYLAPMVYASKLKNYSLTLSLIAISGSSPKLFTIFGGYFTDKTQHKFKNISLSAIVRCALRGIVGLLFISNVNQWSLVIIVVTINSISDIFGAYSNGLISPLAVDLAGKDHSEKTEGFTNGANEVINIAAQFIGLALPLIMSYSSLVFLNTVSFLLAGILFTSVGLRQKPTASLKSHEIGTQSFLVTMRVSFKQVRKQTGLLGVVLTVVVLNGSLSPMGSPIPIMTVAHKTAMVTSRYNFTTALMGVVVAYGATLGNMFGMQLLEKFTIFSMTVLATLIVLMTTFVIFAVSIYLVSGLHFLLALTVSTTSVKLTRWLVTSAEHEILASAVGPLDAILIAPVSLMATILTAVSGATNIRHALILLVALEVITFLVELKVSRKVEVASIIPSVKEWNTCLYRLLCLNSPRD